MLRHGRQNKKKKSIGRWRCRHLQSRRPCLARFAPRPSPLARPSARFALGEGSQDKIGLLFRTLERLPRGWKPHSFARPLQRSIVSSCHLLVHFVHLSIVARSHSPGATTCPAGTLPLPPPYMVYYNTVCCIQCARCIHTTTTTTIPLPYHYHTTTTTTATTHYTPLQ